MITAILAFFQAIPAITGGFNNFTNKYFDAKVQILAARIGGDVAVAREIMIQGAKDNATGVDRLKVIAGSKPLMCLVIAFAIPFVLFEWQAIVYDKIWMHGKTATDPITGNLADWGNTIIISIFGSGTGIIGANMFFNRKER